MKQRLTTTLLFYFLMAVTVHAQPYKAEWSSLDKRPIPSRFTDAKFGIFIHWGIYSVPAWAPANADVGIYAKYAEWYWQRLQGGNDPNSFTQDVYGMFREHHRKTWGENFRYQDFAPLWKAENFDPTQWAALLEKSGVKYVILTSKHHEGFTLWPSAQSWNWNSVDVGPHRDLCGDLSAAVKARGLKMGFYYSLYEWFNPLYLSNPEKYVSEHMLPQMKDLVLRYKPDLLYPDGEWDHPSATWQSEKFLAWLYNDSPVKDSVVVNDRWGKETRSKHGGYYSTEYGQIHGDQKAGDMSAHPWEEIRGMGTSFGYNRIEDVSHYLSSKDLIHLLIRTVSEGGNLCLNIGPTADGRIPVIMQQRLTDIGNWLKVNGEAIYGTRIWAKRQTATTRAGVFFTQKGNDVYAIVTHWSDKPLVLQGVANIGAVSLLGYEGKVRFTNASNKLTIYPPSIHPGNSPCEHAWVFKLSGK